MSNGILGVAVESKCECEDLAINAALLDLIEDSKESLTARTKLNEVKALIGKALA